MHWIDWSILLIYLVWIVWSGMRYGRKNRDLDDYLLADRSLPWWAVGLSVMATQMSAITLIGATGQAYADGMRFIQFYLGLPLAMIILCVTVVPFFHRAKVYTAYEYLERRFDARTRSLTSLLFLISRCLGVGVIISAPAIVLSAILGAPLSLTIILIGVTTTIYTMIGGVRAVAWTDVRQMVVIGVALAAVFIITLDILPEEVGIVDALDIAGLTDRTRAIDPGFDWNENYTLWSGLIGGLFLMLSYFGCDQSQVQRYLTASSVDEARRSLILNALAKIPLQFMILLIGVLVFVYYHYVQPPLVFDPHTETELRLADPEKYSEREEGYAEAARARREAADAYVRGSLRVGEDTAYDAANTRMEAIRRETFGMEEEKKNYPDVNYVFPHFVVSKMPIGLVGLFIAALFAAAMSSIAAELNALSTATVVDFYRRHFRPHATDREYLRASRLFTLGWGLFACGVAFYATSLGSLIEVVNKLGSFFYGSLLGVFVLAFGFKRVGGRGAFWGLIAGMASIAILNNLEALAVGWDDLTGSDGLMPIAEALSVSFLWYNVIGCLVVVAVGVLVSGVGKPNLATEESDPPNGA